MVPGTSRKGTRGRGRGGQADPPLKEGGGGGGLGPPHLTLFFLLIVGANFFGCFQKNLSKKIRIEKKNGRARNLANKNSKI